MTTILLGGSGLTDRRALQQNLATFIPFVDPWSDATFEDKMQQPKLGCPTLVMKEKSGVSFGERTSRMRKMSYSVLVLLFSS